MATETFDLLTEIKETVMAGTQGPNGKNIPPKVAKTATSGKPAGGPAAPSGGGTMSKGLRPKPTNSKARGPR